MIKSHKFPWDELAIDEENFEFHNFFWAVGNAIKKIEKHEKSCNERVLNSVDKFWVFNDFFFSSYCMWMNNFIRFKFLNSIVLQILKFNFHLIS